MVQARQQGVSRGAFEAEGKRAGEGLSTAGDGRPLPGLMRTRPAALPARGPTSQSSGQQLHGLRTQVPPIWPLCRPGAPLAGPRWLVQLHAILAESLPGAT